MRLLPLCALFVAALSAPAAAFEIDGFRAGNSLDEVRARAAQADYLLAPVQGVDGLYSVARRGERTAHATITFCESRDALFAYYTTTVGGFDAFVRMAERETLRLGDGRYEASTTEGPGGPTSSLRITWKESWWTVSVSAATGPTYSLSAARGLSAFDALCRKGRCTALAPLSGNAAHSE
jgi:hypothetical protein